MRNINKVICFSIAWSIIIALAVALITQETQPTKPIIHPELSYQFVRAEYVKQFLRSMKHSKFAGDAETPLHGGGDIITAAHSMAVLALPSDAKYTRLRSYQTANKGYMEIFYYGGYDYYMKVTP